MRIDKKHTAAVVIDIQEKLLPHIFLGDTVVDNSLKLIEGLHILEIPVIVTQQYTRGLGNTADKIVEKFDEFKFIEKSAFSCHDEPAFKEQLTKLDKKFIIICGIEAHVCVLQTCMDLLEDGYVPVVVEDCVSSRNPDDKRVAIERMRQEGARITSFESILFELTRRAGTDTFKSISRLVK